MFAKEVVWFLFLCHAPWIRWAPLAYQRPFAMIFWLDASPRAVGRSTYGSCQDCDSIQITPLNQFIILGIISNHNKSLTELIANIVTTYYEHASILVFFLPWRSSKLLQIYWNIKDCKSHKLGNIRSKCAKDLIELLLSWWIHKICDCLPKADQASQHYTMGGERGSP